MMNARQIKTVVLSGKQGSGKSTTADGLREWANNEKWLVYLFKFADPLYKMHNAIRDCALSYGIDMPAKDGELLQYLGTDWGRKKYGDDVWVKCMRRTLDSLANTLKIGDPKFQTTPTHVVIDDCRFPNEFDSMFDALRVRLTASRNARKARADSWRDNETHPSEIALDDYESDGRFDLRFNTEMCSTEEIVQKIVNEIRAEKTQRRK